MYRGSGAAKEWGGRATLAMECEKWKLKHMINVE